MLTKASTTPEEIQLVMASLVGIFAIGAVAAFFRYTLINYASNRSADFSPKLAAWIHSDPNLFNSPESFPALETTYLSHYCVRKWPFSMSVRLAS